MIVYTTALPPGATAPHEPPERALRSVERRAPYARRMQRAAHQRAGLTDPAAIGALIMCLGR
jgi:hypothetical protein